MQEQLHHDPEKYELMVKRNLNSFVEELKHNEEKKLSNMMK